MVEGLGLEAAKLAKPLEVDAVVFKRQFFLSPEALERVDHVIMEFILSAPS